VVTLLHLITRDVKVPLSTRYPVWALVALDHPNGHHPQSGNDLHLYQHGHHLVTAYDRPS
jgi:hypothetical protein